MRIVLEFDGRVHPVFGALPPSRPIARIAGCVCAVLLTTSGCGQQEAHRTATTAGPTSASSHLTAREKTAASNLVRAFSRSGGFLIGQDGCVATGLVRTVGLPELGAVGLLTEDLDVPKAAVTGDISLSRRDAGMFADAALACMNWRLFAMGVVDDTPDVHDRYDRRCTARVTKRDVRELIVAGYEGAEPGDALPPMYKKLERAGCGFEGDD